VRAFAVDFLLHAADARVFDCAVATVDCRMYVSKLFFATEKTCMASKQSFTHR
jgi:hypothetical protein